MEIRFGQDFSRVRVHTSRQAADSARAMGARAYTVGSDIVFASGQYQPGIPAGDHLLAHELTHVIQHGPAGKPGRLAGGGLAPRRDTSWIASSPGQYLSPPPEVTANGGRGSPPAIWRQKDPAAAATYPTSAEREKVLEVLNPQQQRALETGTAVQPVTDRAGFREAMTARLKGHIDKVLSEAKRRKASSVVLSWPELQGLADVAQAQVTRFYGTYLTAAIHIPAEAAARAGYQLRGHLHEVPSVASTEKTDERAKAWVASRMHKEGAGLLAAYHVLTGEGARDQKLFEDVRDFIFTGRAGDLRTIILFYPGFEADEEAYIQRRLVPESGETPRKTLRRGRWDTLGTTIHEMLHAVRHEEFKQGVTGLEESGIAVEGFAEYFTRPVYDRLSEQAIDDAGLRRTIEGTAGPYVRPPDRTAYKEYFEAVEDLREKLGGNEENLKVAYFLGRIEFLGLGGWNETEAAKRRFPGNMLGAAALLTDTGGGYFRVQYVRVVLGRSGAFQIHLGGALSYLSENQRLGLGGSTYLQYSWPDVYVRGGLDIAGSASAGRPFGESVRLDLIPGAEAGVRIGVVRVGANAQLIIPVAGGPISDRTVRLAAGLGLSASF